MGFQKLLDNLYYIRDFMCTRATAYFLWSTSHQIIRDFTPMLYLLANYDLPSQPTVQFLNHYERVLNVNKGILIKLYFIQKNNRLMNIQKQVDFKTVSNFQKQTNLKDVWMVLFCWEGSGWNNPAWKQEQMFAEGTVSTSSQNFFYYTALLSNGHFFKLN